MLLRASVAAVAAADGSPGVVWCGGGRDLVGSWLGLSVDFGHGCSFREAMGRSVALVGFFRRKPIT